MHLCWWSLPSHGCLAGHVSVGIHLREPGEKEDCTCAAEVKSAQPWLLEERGLVCCLAGRDENLCQLSRDRSAPRSALLSTARV